MGSAAVRPALAAPPSASHPFWTGQGRILDTAGRVEKFERRYGKRARPAVKPAAPTATAKKGA